MSISTMLILIASILTASGIGSRTLYASGADRRSVLFFLLCTCALKTSIITVRDEALISAASILIVVWFFGNSFNREISLSSWFIIPLSMFIALALIPLTNVNGTISSIILLIVAGIAAYFTGLRFALGFAGMLPPAFLTAKYFYEVLNSGFSSLQLTETCLFLQLSGIIISVLCAIIKASANGIAIRPYRKINTLV